MPEKKEDEFAFIKEKIKDKPVNKRRLLRRVAVLAASAVVFGLIACFVITLVQPYMEKWLYPEEKPTVTIPKDELEPETERETERDSDTENTAPVYITETQELETTDYQKLQNKIYAIGEEQNKSIVTVTGVKSDMDWFNTPYESSGQASGIIIANNGQELLILTEKNMSYRAALDDLLSQNGKETMPIMEVGDTQLIRNLLCQGLGISYLPEFVIAEDLAKGNLVSLPMTEIHPDIWRQLLYHRNKWISPELKCVIKYLQEE